MKRKIFFFIGTEAELIKMFPVMLECRAQELPFGIIASGQNNIYRSRIMEAVGNDTIDIYLSDEKNIRKTAMGLVEWFMQTMKHAVKDIREKIPDVDFANSIMVVHGDTVSTLMGAYLGKRMNMTVCHVEAGLRSHHLLNPFPEEIDRLLTSRKSDIHFAPGKSPCENLKKVKGKVINTQYNTIIDSLRYAMKLESSAIELKQPYFVFVLHRQENLMNKKLTADVVEAVQKVAQHQKCVVILHEITKIQFEKYGLMDAVRDNTHFITCPRMEYFDFMKLLFHAEFVLTDGGSNQEELHYMGKPCLILRTATERTEGLDSNALLFNGEINRIEQFAQAYKKYRIHPKIEEEISPSKIIVSELAKLII